MGAFVVFIIIGLPVILYAALRGWQLYLMHQRYEAIIEERKMMLAQGMPVEQLPPLQVPELNIFSGFTKSSQGTIAPPETPPQPEAIATPEIVPQQKSALVRNADPIGEFIISAAVIFLGVMLIDSGHQNGAFVVVGFLFLLLGGFFLIKYLLSLGTKRILLENNAEAVQMASVNQLPLQQKVVSDIPLLMKMMNRKVIDAFTALKAAFIALGIAGGIAAMAIWGNWHNAGTPESQLLTVALFPAVLGVALLLLQLFLSIMRHQLALIKGMVYLVLVALGFWTFPLLYRPDLYWVYQVQRLAIVPFGIAFALLIDYLLSRWLDQKKPVQHDQEKTVVIE